jgi:hypothetical protein
MEDNFKFLNLNSSGEPITVKQITLTLSIIIRLKDHENCVAHVHMKQAGAW